MKWLALLFLILLGHPHVMGMSFCFCRVSSVFLLLSIIIIIIPTGRQTFEVFRQ